MHGGDTAEYIDGFLINNNFKILTATDNFNSTGTGYIMHEAINAENLVNGFMSKPQGNSETGFIPQETNGSATTYFSDYTSKLARNMIMTSSGHFNNSEGLPGIFYFNTISLDYLSNVIGARLMYL